MSSLIFSAAGNLSESFEKLMNEIFMNVDGVLVEKTTNGYKVHGEEVASMEIVKDRINAARENLAYMIARDNPHCVLPKDYKDEVPH